MKKCFAVVVLCTLLNGVVLSQEVKRADLFAGPDSGPMNLAAAVGTETYGLFGLNPSLDYSRHIHVVRAGNDLSLLKTIDQITPDQLYSVLAPRLAALRR